MQIKNILIKHLIVTPLKWTITISRKKFNDKKKMNQLKISLKFRSQIENQVSEYRFMRASSFFNIQNLNIL